VFDLSKYNLLLYLTIFILFLIVKYYLFWYYSMSETQKRPIGVTIIAILSMILGLLSILSGIDTVSNLEGEIVLVGILYLIIGLMALPSGYGLLKGKRWAWNLSIGVAIVNIMRNIVELVLETLDSTTVIMTIIICVLIIAYLMKPSTKAFCSNK
tara:strand:+ start:355 stop:819 length:465 start_codon:yes stop_codon:yes gene_type:complete